MENTIWISEKFTSTLKERKGLSSQPSFVSVVHKRPSHQHKGGRTILFPDDTSIQIEATNANILNKKIKEVMQQLSSWFYSNKLVINTDNTTVILFHAWKNKSNLKPEIVFQDMDIKLYFKTWTLNIKMKQNFYDYILLKK
jgi:hypothetical protein